MAEVWDGAARQVLVDDASRTTYGNARAAAAAARKLGVREVVLVTSGWHSRRASVLLAAAHGDRVSVAATDERGTRSARARELRVLARRARCRSLSPAVRASVAA